MPERNGSPRARVAIGVALAALVIGAYWKLAGNGFIGLDDNDYVTRNPRVQAGLSWSGVEWAFATTRSANWHPLTWLSHMLDCQMYGMNAGRHHLTSLALHVASTLLLYRLFLRTTGALLASAFVAAVFGLHPLHVESVAWVAERKDVLSAFLWILTTLAYVEWTEKGGTGRYLLVIGLYALGLMSKPMLVTLPFTLLLLDVWPLRRAKASLREKIPLFALAALSSVVTFLVQHAHGAMALGERVPFGLRAGNAVVAYVLYLAKSVAPFGLAVYYPYPKVAYPAWQVAGAALLLLAVTVWVWRERGRRPWLAVGWLWFVGTLVPVIGFVQVGTQAMADRYAYIPLIGLSVAVAYSARLLPALLVVLVPAWTALTWDRASAWKDDRTLFGPLAETMPENDLAHHVLGCAYLREHRYDEAIAEFREALRLRPSYAEARSNLGAALELSGRPAEATVEYEAAVRASPNRADLRYNLGRALALQGRPDAALEQYEAAVRSDPDLAEAQGGLGELLLRAGRTREAIPHLEKALELRPGWTEARRLLESARAGSRP